MRSVIEIVILGAVVALAWEKSISERVGEVIPALAAKEEASGLPRRARPVAANANGAWMWDSNRRSVLDRPAYDPKERQSWTADNYGRRYRVDAQGKRHYER